MIDENYDKRMLREFLNSLLTLYTKATGNKIDIPEAVQKHTKPSEALGVPWAQARSYCKWLGKLTKTTFDLPTEAQWEYAARSRGVFIVYPTNNGKINYNKNIPTISLTRSLAQDDKYGIALYPPNKLGIYDLIHAPQWVKDWYSSEYYKSSPRMDPQGPSSGTKRVRRSSDAASYSMSMHRNGVDPTRGAGMFRCAVEKTTPSH